MLVERCEAHPLYLGERPPDPTVDGGSTCRFCWELYRKKHEGR